MEDTATLFPTLNPDDALIPIPPGITGVVFNPKETFGLAAVVCETPLDKSVGKELVDIVPDEKMVDVTDVLFAGDPTKPAIDEILDDGTRDVLVGLELFTVAKLKVRGLAATVLAGETELTPLVVMVKLPEADDTVEVTDVGSVEPWTDTTGKETNHFIANIYHNVKPIFDYKY